MIRSVLSAVGFVGLTWTGTGNAQIESSSSQGVYRLPYADGTKVKVFDDFESHRPQGRTDLFAVEAERPVEVVAAADGVVRAIQDSFSEQQSGRSANLCHNNYVWIEHANGEWTNYSHIALHSATGRAGLHVGDRVRAGQQIGYEGAVGCAMLDHVHFEVAVPSSAPIGSGGFLNDNDGGERERKPRFCGVPNGVVEKGMTYVARPCS